MLRIKKLNFMGDTLVEVLFAITIISFVLAGGYVATKTSLSTELAAGERSTAVQASQTQIEVLQSLFKNNLAQQKSIEAYLQNGSSYGQQFCVNNQASPPIVVPKSGNDCSFDSNGTMVSASGALTYSITMVGDPNISNQVDLTSTWYNSHGSKDTLTMDVRLLSSIAINTTVPVACPPGDTGTPPNCIPPCPVGEVGTPPNCQIPCTSGNKTFAFTGAPQAWSPSGIDSSCSVTITIAAADGGSEKAYGTTCSGNGGAGSEYSLTISEKDLVSALNGKSLDFYVGQKGGDGTTSPSYGGGGGGGYSGGAYYSIGGAGGGATWVTFNGSTVAGAGGGGGGGAEANYNWCPYYGLDGGGGPYSPSASFCYSYVSQGITWHPCLGGLGGQLSAGQHSGGPGGNCNTSTTWQCAPGQPGSDGTATQGGWGGAAGGVDWGYCYGGAGGGGGGSVVRAGGGGGGSNTEYTPNWCDWDSGGGGGGGADMWTNTPIPWSEGGNTYNGNGNGFVKISWN